MPLDFNLSFAFFFGLSGRVGMEDDALRRRHTAAQPDTTLTQGKPALPCTQTGVQHDNQQQMLEEKGARRGREKLADEESLRHLEAATASGSRRAKTSHQETSVVLVSSTTSLDMPGREMETASVLSPSTAERGWTFTDSLPSGKDTTDSQSLCTEHHAGTASSGNAFEDYLRSDLIASRTAEAVARPTSQEDLQAKLAAAGWSKTSIAAATTTQEECTGSQVKLLRAWFERLEQADKQDASEEASVSELRTAEVPEGGSSNEEARLVPEALVEHGTEKDGDCERTHPAEEESWTVV